MVGFGVGAAHQLLHKQALHFAAAEEALHGIDGAVGQGALHLHRLFGELELPLQVTPLPALLLQHRQHHLGEGVNGDFVDALG